MNSHAANEPESKSSPAVDSPTEQQKKPYGRNWKKWILAYLIIGALIYAVIYYLVLSNQDSNPYSVPITKTAPSPSITSDPTADWKPYTNDDYDFSFKYPPQYSVTPITEITKSYNSDGKPLEVTQYAFPFSLGKMFNGTPDQSGFILEIQPTFGKTIAEEYGNNTALGGGRVEITYLAEAGGADEAAIIRPSNSGRVYRAGNFFYLEPISKPI